MTFWNLVTVSEIPPQTLTETDLIQKLREIFPSVRGTEAGVEVNVRFVRRERHHHE